ncbi:MAG: HPF/RaiA family ribosome-associated protein [Rhodospirillales bacterium]|jgi:ribosomal subunit interface protein|nr:HPF/RaiA family ribosome-associated protein [Rhodospirillales bacterium]
MQMPLDIDFQNLEPSDFVASRIRERAAKLKHLSDRVTSCRVVVQAPHRHHQKGNAYHVRILLRLPSDEIVVSRDPGDHRAHDDVYVAIRDAFDAAERQLKTHFERQRTA